MLESHWVSEWRFRDLTKIGQFWFWFWSRLLSRLLYLLLARPLSRLLSRLHHLAHLLCQFLIIFHQTEVRKNICIWELFTFVNTSWEWLNQRSPTAKLKNAEDSVQPLKNPKLKKKKKRQKKNTTHEINRKVNRSFRQDSTSEVSNYPHGASTITCIKRKNCLR